MWGMRYLSSVRLSAHSTDREAEHCTAKRHRQQDVLISTPTRKKNLMKPKTDQLKMGKQF